MKVYISGPMTGLPKYNYPAFHEAEANLIALGYTPINPARWGVVPEWTWQDYMRRAVADVSSADAIALLPGWEKSKGARAEFSIAVDLGLITEPLDFWLGYTHTPIALRPEEDA